MPYCSFCNRKLNGEENFCPDCGQRLKRDHNDFTPKDRINTQQEAENVPPMPEINRKNTKKTKPKVKALPLSVQKNKFAGGAYSLSTLVLELGSLLFIALCTFIISLFINDKSQFDSIRGYLSFAPQFVLILFVLIFCRVNRLSMQDIGLRKTVGGAFVVVVGVFLGFFGRFVANIPETYFQEFLQMLGYNTSVGGAVEDLSTEGIFLYITFAIVAILPAIFEELLFRGIILENTKHLGTLRACLINGLLFSLFHANPMQTGYTFIMGAVWALIAIRANSVLPTMLIHLVSNGYSLLLIAIGTDNLPQNFGTVMLMSALVITAFGLWYFIRFNRFGQVDKASASPARGLWISALPGLAINIFLWLLTFLENVGRYADTTPTLPTPPTEIIESVTAAVSAVTSVIPQILHIFW